MSESVHFCAPIFLHVSNVLALPEPITLTYIRPRILNPIINSFLLVNSTHLFYYFPKHSSLRNRKCVRHSSFPPLAAPSRFLSFALTLTTNTSLTYGEKYSKMVLVQNCL